MHFNDVKLVRVYSREERGKILEQCFPSDAEFEIVVEAKAGEAIHGGGGPYLIQVAVRDLTDFKIVHDDRLQGNLTDDLWHEPMFSYAFRLPAQGTTKENHIYEALASLSVGLRKPNVSFAKSPIFIICRP